MTNQREKNLKTVEPPGRSDCTGSAGRLGASWQLLVSVRDATEAESAIESGVDIVDLKEPAHGPLAPVEPELWQHIVDLCERLACSASSSGPQLPSPTSPSSVVDFPPSHRCVDLRGRLSGRGGADRHVHLSAALGEPDDALAIAAAVPCRFAFAKVGPSGCRTVEQLGTLWQQLRERLAEGIELVAVAYADHRQADCLPPESVFQSALDFGLHHALVDTFTKDGRSTLDHLGWRRLRELSQLAGVGPLWWTLAGSLRAEMLPVYAEAGIAPNCVGVRGDVCRQDRTGQLDLERIERWRNTLATLRSGAGS